VVSCSSEPDLFCEIFDNNKNKITIDELVRIYFNNPDSLFCFKEKQETIVDTDTDTDNHSNNNNFSKTDVGEEQGTEQKITPDEYIETFNVHSTQKIEEKEQGISTYYYSCYYCNDFQPTNEEAGYKNHIIIKHMLSSSDKDQPCYSCKADIERLGLKAQGKNWEI